MSLANKVAVVTGSASGIGRACAVQLAKDGAAVSLWDLDAKGTEETAAIITKAGGRAMACIGDASSREGIAAALERTRKEFGPVTILVNNAGVSPFNPFLEITEESFDRTIRINLKGPFLCTQAIIPDMLAAKWGRIVNISSSSTQSGAKSMAHYVSSKGGVIGLTRALASEFAENGITVNNIPPGFIDTPMLRASPVNVDAYAATMPMKRAGKPEDIAAACSYLCSEGAGYVTGHTLSVNGGRYFN
jgi:2-hydroxycyclohexanecarboxyl-CoA dehydrogenase